MGTFCSPGPQALLGQEQGGPGTRARCGGPDVATGGSLRGHRVTDTQVPGSWPALAVPPDPHPPSSGPRVPISHSRQVAVRATKAHIRAAPVGLSCHSKGPTVPPRQQ